MKKPERSPDWYLKPPFASNPLSKAKKYFAVQHWWNEDEPGQTVTPEAALYELVRRHPRTGQILLGLLPVDKLTAVDLFLLHNAHSAWPWLTADAHEQWRTLAKPHKQRMDARLKIITNFEGSEVGRRFKFHAPAKVDFHKWKSATKLKESLPLKANEAERRAFERVVSKAVCQLSAVK